MENYSTEVKARWGGTAAHAEYENKISGYTADKWQEVNDGLNTIFGKFAECMHGGYTALSPEAQDLVKELQNYITKNYYTCTNEILAGLGQMYVTDERFSENIDKHGLGTTQFVSEAVKSFSLINSAQ